MHIGNSRHRAINEHKKYFSIFIIVAFKTLLIYYYLLTKYTATNVIIIVVVDNNNNSKSPLVWNIVKIISTLLPFVPDVFWSILF